MLLRGKHLRGRFPSRERGRYLAVEPCSAKSAQEGTSLILMDCICPIDEIASPWQG